MIATLFAAPGLTGMHVDNDRSSVWFTRDDGSLLSADPAGNVTTHQVIGTAPVDIGGSPTLLAVAAADGTVWTVDPDDPATPAVQLAVLPAVPTQIAVSPKGKVVLAVVDGHGVSVGVADGQTSPNAVPAGGVGVTPVGRALAVSVNDPITGAGTFRRLGGLGAGPVSTPVAPLGRVGAAADGLTVFGAHPAGSSLTAWTPGAAALATVGTTAVPGAVIEAQGLADGRIVVLTDQELVVVDDLSDLATGGTPTITAPDEPLFVASWVRLGYDLGTTGLSARDISFVVPDGPDAGLVSFTREDDDSEPSPILVAGGRLGTFKVVMVENSTGNEIAGAEFTVTNEWEDASTGPSMMITDASTDFAGDSGWGGGPGTAQNLGDLAHTGSWNVLVLLVDTSTARWPNGSLAQDRTDALDHVINGFPVGGTSRSARLYYDENSSAQLNLAAHGGTTFGPVAMPNDWGSYFTQTVDGAGVVTDARWAPKGTTWQAVISQAVNDGVVTTADLRAVDSVVFMPFSPDATSAAGNRFAWPYGSVGKSRMLLGTNITTDQGDVACAQVPLNFAAQDGRQTHSSLSHELGHNLGLLDVYDIADYPDDVSARITSSWEMMAGSRDTLPHYSVSNKMRMGWVPNAQVKLFNFQGAGGVDQTVTLHAAELGAPPGGRFRCIEIRLGDGWNYYVEYRSEQAGFISDDVPTDRRVVLTDATSENFTAPVLRPRILFVPDDADGDGRILDVGSDFEATDPGTGFDLSIAVVSTDEDNAVVRVRYGSNARPELGIRPWDNGPTWQSPDIEVRNAKNAADPSLFNVPWAGRPNTVVAKVKNNGDFPATGVAVDFFVTEYSAGDGPWLPLGTSVRDVAPGATVDFTVGWTPPADESLHHCVIVRIKLYQDPGNPAILDANIYNNEARSNFTRFISASASPSSRVGTSVLLSNPFSQTTTVTARVRQTHDLHRVFVDHTWLTVEPGSPRAVTVLDEALFGTAEWPVERDDRGRWRKRLWGVPNRVSVDGWARNPRAEECAGLVPTGGCCLSVQAARATVVRIGEATSQFVFGEVGFVDDGSPVPDQGVVLVEVGGRDATWTFTTPTSGGQFRAEVPRKDEPPQWLVAHYLGAFGAAPSASERREL